MNIALIFAGGVGSRMRSKAKPKQFLELNGKAIIIYTIENFEAHPQIDAILVVCLEDWIPYLKTLLEKNHISKARWIVPGGESGQQSIFNGLNALWQDESVPNDSLVLIHDGVRPLIDSDTITRNIDIASKHGNAVTVSPAVETIVTLEPGNRIKTIMDRKSCHLARAPQTFRLSDIYGMHLRAQEDDLHELIDSASLMAHYGYSVHAVQGPAENIKITTPSDFYVFKAMYKTKENSEVWGIS